MAMGRRPKYHTDTLTNKTVNGLYKMPGKRPRWRYKDAKGKYVVFTERNEQKAISHFLQATQGVTVEIPGAVVFSGVYPVNAQAPMAEQTIQALASHVDPVGTTVKAVSELVSPHLNIAPPVDDPNVLILNHVISEAKLYEWFRVQLLNHPDHVARMTGLPGLKTAVLDVAKPSLNLQKLIDLYCDESDTNKNTKSHARTDWKRMTKFTGARVVDDLTTDALRNFRQHVVDSGIAPSGAGQIFGKIKSTIAFAIKSGEDADQLTALLGRMKVLFPPKNTSKPEPKPISPENFQKLLNKVDDEWRLMCLLGLNAALYIEDLCELRWDEIDLEAKTFKSIRKKTGVARVATLWDETVEAIKKWPHRAQSPYVFTSSQGRRFNTAGRYNTYKKVRERAEVTDSFSSLRDAAYTCAAQNVDERFARVLAGHRSAGLQDSYVLRNPQFVKPACDAIYRVFGPFHEQTTEVKK